jgi:tetratricopeptide (TPR) repeat protein
MLDEVKRKPIAATPENPLAALRAGLPPVAQLLAARARKLAGDLEGGAQILREILQSQPENFDAWNNLGNLLRDQGRFAEALACAVRALEIRPGHRTARANHIITLIALKHFDEAHALLSAWRDEEPHEARPWTLLAQAFGEQGRHEAAKAAAREALARAPGDAQALVALGWAAIASGDYQVALEAADQALAADAHDGAAGVVRCQALLSLGQIETGCGEARDLVARGVGGWRAQAALSRALFLAGSWSEAWAPYESRWRIAGPVRATPPAPRWSGEPCAGRRILLVAEQGLGDSIQFARLAWTIAARGGEAVLHLQKELQPLFTRLPAGVRFETLVDPGAIDLWAPLLSAPGALGVGLAPMTTPYVSPPEGASAPGSLEASPSAPLRVGLVWRGNPSHSGDALRSIDVAQVLSLAGVAGVRLFALQVGGDPAAELDRAGAKPFITDLSPDLTGWARTAAALAKLDLLVTVDTACAHLAGAMGRPAWVLLPYAPDWRWGATGTTTDWYPTLRLYRQERSCDWAAPLARLRADLERLASDARLRQAATGSRGQDRVA